MKISAFWKSSLKEIKQSFGRFIAIFAIVALGVGFFAGLKVTQGAMLATGEKYLEEQQFYDFRMLSTLGYDEGAVELIGGHPQVRTARGAMSFDIMHRSKYGNDEVLKAHSITEGVNQLVISAGRMPEKPGECVVDDLLFTAEDIGQKLVLSPSNTSEDLEHFAFQEYTIVGTCQSSYYVQFERGNSSLGNGRVTGFVYMLPEGFATDYYTEIFVKLEKDYPLYSEEYDVYIDGLTEEFEALAQQGAENRYHEIWEEANQELSDARQELAEGEAEGLQELADAWTELEDARVQLEDAAVELEDGFREIADAKQEIADSEKELADAERTIEEKEAELADGLVQYEDGMKQWQESRAELAKADAELSKQAEELDAQKTVLDAREQELLQLEALLNSGVPGLPVTAEQIAAGKAEIVAARQIIAGYEQQILVGEYEIRRANGQIWEAYEELQDAKVQLEDGAKQLEDARVELADGRKKLQEGRQDLVEGEAELLEGQQEYEDGLAEYREGLADYEEGKAEFEQEIADAKAEIADGEAELADLAVPDSYLLGRDTNVGYVCFENDSAIISGIANVFPVFFFLVAALVCITTMNRMVEEQRTQIGVLKALGYSDGKIMSKYFFYAGSAAVAGWAVGYFGGSYLFPAVIWYAYGIMYQMDVLVYLLDPGLGMIALAASMVASVGATWWSCKSELTQVAAQLIRPKSPQSGKRIFLEYLPVVWNRLGFLQKVSVRNIFRYKKRLIMMVIGISGCTALLVTGFGVKDSIAAVADQQFGEIQIFEMGVDYEDTVSAADLEALSLVEGIRDYVVLSQETVDLVGAEMTKSINLVVFPEGEDMSVYVNLHTPDKEALDYPGDGEAVISHKIAERMDLQVGDRITLRNENMEEITATISGIHENFVYSYVYLNEATYEQALGRMPERKSLYVNGQEGVDLHEISAQLMDLEHVLAVSINKDTLDRLNSMLGCMDLIVIFIILCAAGLAFIVLYNLTNINIMERIREIATIKVLGFQKNETRAYVFRENLVLTCMGAALGLLLGKWLHAFVMSQVNIDMVAFQVTVLPVSYLYSVLFTVGFALFVGWVMGRKLDNISMTESLKSVD